MPTTVIKSIGARKDFASLNAFNTYVHGRSLITNDEIIIGEVYENQNITGSGFNPRDVDNTHYCLVRPAPGLGVNDLDAAGPLDYGTVGIELTADASSFGTVNNGMIIEGFRIHITGTNTGGSAPLSMTKYTQVGANSNIQDLRKNRFLVESTTVPVAIGNSGGIGHIYDNVIIMKSNPRFAEGDTMIFERNTVVRRNASTGPIISSVQAYGTSRFHNNVFLDCGDAPTDRANSNNDGLYQGNFSNVDKAASQVGVTAVTTGALVVDTATDLRPTAGGPLIGAAVYSADGTADIRGGNRGPDPDVGALQLVPAPPAPTGTITSQVLNGQTLTISGTTTGSPTAGTVTLAPSGAGSTAVACGPVAVTLGANTFTVTVDAVVPGDYAAPVAIFRNAGGASAPASGSSAFSIIGISGNPAA